MHLCILQQPYSHYYLYGLSHQTDNTISVVSQSSLLLSEYNQWMSAAKVSIGNSVIYYCLYCHNHM